MSSISNPLRIYLLYTLGFLGLIIANKLGESSCWFYSDARGEYSFSELFTNVLYLVSTILLLTAAWKRKNAWLIPVALFCALLLLEEANYGQIFWESGATPLFENEEQAALHTQLLRPLKVTSSMDGAEFLSLAMQGGFAVALPLFLHLLLRRAIPFLFLVTPLLLFLLCHLGKWNAILVPWTCGYDAFEEMTETLMAATSLFWTLLYFAYSDRLRTRDSSSD